MIVRGVVATFNEQRGDGVIRDHVGNAFYFHCVSLLDGTRSVQRGTSVRGVRAVGHLGADEVRAVETDVA